MFPSLGISIKGIAQKTASNKAKGSFFFFQCAKVIPSLGHVEAGNEGAHAAGECIKIDVLEKTQRQTPLAACSKSGTELLKPAAQQPS